MRRVLTQEDVDKGAQWFCGERHVICDDPLTCSRRVTECKMQVSFGDDRDKKKEGVVATLQERGSRYGDFTDNASIAQELKTKFQDYQGWRRLDDTKREALEMIAQKIARILNGDPNYKDNWHDIAGYATLAEERCVDKSEG